MMTTMVSSCPALGQARTRKSIRLNQNYSLNTNNLFSVVTIDLTASVLLPQSFLLSRKSTTLFLQSWAQCFCFHLPAASFHPLEGRTDVFLFALGLCDSKCFFASTCICFSSVKLFITTTKTLCQPPQISLSSLRTRVLSSFQQE